MRLSKQTQKVILETTAEIFGQNASVTLFGSRVDDAIKGGDIDLLIQLNEALPQREKKALQLVSRLQIRLGDQPIDVLVLDPTIRRQPVHNEAILNGIIL